MYRNTYVEINLKNLEYNVNKIIKKFNNYKYYIGVVKADCYGHNGIKSVQSIINGGCNYLAVATLDEAIEIRKTIKEIPILCLGIVPLNFIQECIKNNVTITISNVDYLRELLLNNYKDLKVHIKINTGMNRLGVNNTEDFNAMYKLITESNLILEGIYTHMHTALNEEITKGQIKRFENITKDIDLSSIPIVHLCASDATMEYEKPSYANGCRLGISMYGLMESNSLNLLPTFSLYSEIIQINTVTPGETVGYNGNYKVNAHEKIAVIPIGYDDGIIRKNTGRDVYINEKPYPIVGNICMDMLFVKVDDTVKIHDKVTVIKDTKHIMEIAKHLDTIPYEVICSISKRVPRIYKK